MPPSGIAQTALSSVAARVNAPRGAQSGVAALIAQQQESQSQMDKLLKTIEKLQQENAEEVQRAAQAGAGAATQIANQVAAGIEKAAAAGQRTRERAEDKQFAIDQQLLNSQLQEEAARTAASMAASVQASKDKFSAGLETVAKSEADWGKAISGLQARLQESRFDPDWGSAKSRDTIERITDLLETAMVMKESRFGGGKHMRAAMRLMHEEIADILKKKNPLSLESPNPLLRQVADMRGPTEKTGTLRDMDPDDAFDLKMAGGYPPRGIFTGEKNHSLPEGLESNYVNSAVGIRVLLAQENERILLDENIRSENQRNVAKDLLVTRDNIDKMKDIQRNLNIAYNPKAGPAMEAALEDFITDPDMRKLKDPGKYIATRAMVHLYGGGAKGEEMAQTGLEFHSAKRQAKSEHDFGMLAAMESGSFALQSHFGTAIAAGGVGGGNFATILVNQIEARVGREQMLRMLGVDDSNIAIVDAQEVVQNLLMETRTMLQGINHGTFNSGLMQEFISANKTNLMMMDIHLNQTSSDGVQRESRLDELMAEVGSPVSEGGPTGSQFEESLKRGQTPEFTGLMTTVESYIDVYGSIKTDIFNRIGGVLTNELDPIGDVDSDAIIQQGLDEDDRSEYAKRYGAVSQFPYLNKKENRERAQKLAKEQEQQGPSVQGAGRAAAKGFEAGGAGAAVVTAVPELFSLAQAGVVGAARVAGPAVLKVVGGEGLANLGRLGGGVATGNLPLPSPSEAATIREGNLTPQEIRQVVQESAKDPTPSLLDFGKSFFQEK